MTENEAEENHLCFDCVRNPPVLTIAEKIIATEGLQVRCTKNAPAFNEAITLFTRIFILTDFNEFCSNFAVLLLMFF